MGSELIPIQFEILLLDHLVTWTTIKTLKISKCLVLKITFKYHAQLNSYL